MKERIPKGLRIGLALVAGALVFVQVTAVQASSRSHRHHQVPTPPVVQQPIAAPSPVVTMKNVFTDTFSTNSTLEEMGTPAESPSADWWLSSGAQFIVENGVGKTIQGSLASTDSWFKEYLIYNPVDTDGGTHPQNIFRLVTKSQWQNFRQQAYFEINQYNLSNSPERYDPNGLFFFNRYIDQNNLYYTGIRVDGTAVVKKKINGNYYTLSQTKIFPGTYNRLTNPNLLPVGSWIGLRSEVTTNSDGTVNVKVYVDKNNDGNWTLVINAKDDGSSYGGKAITSTGFAGIRTDFMDAQMDNYQISEFN